MSSGEDRGTGGVRAERVLASWVRSLRNSGSMFRAVLSLKENLAPFADHFLSSFCMANIFGNSTNMPSAR